MQIFRVGEVFESLVRVISSCWQEVRVHLPIVSLSALDVFSSDSSLGPKLYKLIQYSSLSTFLLLFFKHVFFNTLK